MRRPALLAVLGLANCSPAVDVGPLPAEPRPLEGDIDVADHDGATHAQANDFFTELSGVGDFDGDGCDDLVVSGSSAYSENVGFAPLATILYGEPGPLRQRHWDHASTKIFGGTTSNRALGVGDLDGDGFPDLAVRTDERGLRLFRGGSRRPAELHLDDADFTIDGDNRAMLLPASGHGGDVTGDGVADLVLGRYGDIRSAYSPTVHIIPGSEAFYAASSVRYDAAAVATVSVAGGTVEPVLVEDIDGDGVADIVLASDAGDPSQVDLSILRGGDALSGPVDLSTAAATLRLGSTPYVSSLHDSTSPTPSLLISAATLQVWGDLDAEPRVLDSISGRMQSAGDLDGDGLGDVLVERRETVSVFYGTPNFRDGSIPPAATLHLPAAPLDRVRVAPVGDFNCDGFDDIAFSVARADSSVHILYGAPR